MYLLDTCVVSEARRHTPEAVAWIRAANPDALFLSVITVGEIMKGIVMKARADPPAAASLQRWLDELRLWLLLGSGVVGLGAWVANVEGIWCDGGSAGPTGLREEFPPSWLHWTCSTSPA